MSDYQRELLSGDDNSDKPSLCEMLAEIRAQIEAIEGGDVSSVAPWSTADDTLADLRTTEETYCGPRTYGHSGGEDFARGT